MKFLRELATNIRYAFQPIVSMHTGRCYAVEALMRNWHALGFESADALLDFAHEHGVLEQADEILRTVAFRQFRRIPHAEELRLFFNLDDRLFTSHSYRPESMLVLSRECRLNPAAVVLEVFERERVQRSAKIHPVLNAYRGSGIQIAIGHFGTGFSGLAPLYDSHPDYIKIDRHFIADMGQDPRKKIFVSHMVNLAKTLGVRVIADGVETEQELHICREIGCDLVQGYLLQHPTTEINALKRLYGIVPALKDCRRPALSGARLLADQLDTAPTLDVGMPMLRIFEQFRSHPHRSFFPFLAKSGEPLGIVRETELKEYIYSPYGRHLLSKKIIDDYLDTFVRRCPVADINSSIDTILEQYTASRSREGVIITEDGSYRGLLSAEALLLAIQERNVQKARDENPLTHLPGNRSIERFIAEGLADSTSTTALVYLDLDNFKVFNDVYGFRRGDRLLLLFADLIHKQLGDIRAFVGHIGGDDFFVGLHQIEFTKLHEAVETLISRFRADVTALYDEAHRKAGGLVGTDREGRTRWFELITASAAVVEIAPGSRWRADYLLSELIAQLKREAKREGGAVFAAGLA